MDVCNVIGKYTIYNKYKIGPITLPCGNISSLYFYIPVPSYMMPTVYLLICSEDSRVKHFFVSNYNS